MKGTKEFLEELIFNIGLKGVYREERGEDLCIVDIVHDGNYLCVWARRQEGGTYGVLDMGVSWKPYGFIAPTCLNQLYVLYNREELFTQLASDQKALRGEIDQMASVILTNTKYKKNTRDSNRT